ncbi:hypothetical protein G7072_04130 [Nocardioides sp. HDW12B]|uniref:hypothetical protein n=1 Tax=Nocardioides sp. HDW12B TaxID=2714939 RepID=UPI001408335F|nr:hypothetical protein [Nocardioides sp. HDW12B]QIK65631.1 hypothetical protein G7072_04130 [Nocardioides sp. HDW12B]
MTSTHQHRLGATLLLVAVLLVALPSPASATTSPACATAQQLTDAGDPAAALASIAELRKADPVAAGTTPVCAEEYAAAVERQAQDKLDATTTPAQDADAGWSDLREQWLDPGLVLAAVVLGWLALVLVLARLLLGLVGRHVSDPVSTTRWLRRTCRYVAWAALVGGAVSLVGLPEAVSIAAGPAWSGEGTDLGTDLGLVAVLVATVLILVLGWRRAAARDDDAASSGAAVALVAAVGLVAVAGLVLSLDVSLEGPPLTPTLGVATLLGVAAAALLAIDWGASARLTITTTGDGAPSPEHLRSLVGRLAPTTPGGIEVPLGTDAELLEDVGIVETSSTPWIAALGRALRLLRAPSPWRLVVTAKDDSLVVDLLRNHRLVDTQSVDRQTALGFLRYDVPTTAGAAGAADPTEGLDLGVFPAALAVTRIARAHGITQGLAGATVARSIALHALAAQEPRGSSIAQALFAEAVDLDPANQLALVGYWHSLYREAGSSEELGRYLELLGSALASDVVRREPALRLRLLHTRVAVGINRASLLRQERDQAAGAERRFASEALEAQLRGLARDAKRLTAAVADPGTGVDDEFRCRLQRSSEMLTRSVPACPAVGWKPGPERLRRPEEYGPGLNYAAGCFLAESAGKAAIAVRHLACADVDPTLARWREADPQLARLRTGEATGDPLAPRTNPYRQAFGRPLPEDMLELAPFAECATVLRSAGLVTIDRLSRTSLDQLESIGLPPAAGSWLRALTVVARSARVYPGLKPWHLAVTSELAALGEITAPPLGISRDELVRELEARLAAYVSSPARGVVDAWLRDRESQTFISQGSPGTPTPAFPGRS